MVKGILNKGATITADNVYQPHIYDEGGITDTVSEHISEIIAEKQSDIDEEIFSHAVYQTYTRETEDDPDEVDFSTICEGNKTAIIMVRGDSLMTTDTKIYVKSKVHRIGYTEAPESLVTIASLVAQNTSRTIQVFAKIVDSVVSYGFTRNASNVATGSIACNYTPFSASALKDCKVTVEGIPVGDTVYLYTV